MQGSDRCFGLLLAAGFSRRFGDDKRLQPFVATDNETSAGSSPRPLGIATTARWLDACVGQNRLHHLYVVTRSDDRFLEALRGFLADHSATTQCTPLVARDAKHGMGHSLAQAVVQIPEGSLIVGLADMPYVLPATIRTLVKTLATSPKDRVVQPHYRTKPGNPIGFGLVPRQMLAQSKGDEGARARVREAHSTGRLIAVDVDDAGILYDIDRPEDLLTH